MPERLAPRVSEFDQTLRRSFFATTLVNGMRLQLRLVCGVEDNSQTGGAQEGVAVFEAEAFE